jgi:hypothetical protein
MYVGSGPLTLDTPQSRCYTVSADDASGAQDLLHQVSSLGRTLTTRLILKTVVLVRRCRRHIYHVTTSYSLIFRLVFKFKNKKYSF